MRGNLSIPGTLVGYGLGSFVASGLSDEQIVAHVLCMIANIRQTFGDVPKAAEAAHDEAADDVNVH